MSHTDQTHLVRYAKLISSILVNSDASAPLIDTFPDAFASIRIAHRPLLIYSDLLANNPSPSLRNLIPALDDSIWSMLVLHIAGEKFNQPAWIKQANDAFKDLVDHQQPTGEFFSPDPSTSPEARWYDELVTLHALTSYVVGVPTPAMHSAIKRSAEFHLQETQPDHATAQPWALHAFIQHAPLLADQMLHAMQMQYPAGITGIPLLLLRDVRYGLQKLITND